jgi:hypothetical protein
MAMLMFDPFDTLFQFQQALEAFRTSGWLGSCPSASGAYPPINVFRKGDDIVVIAEVPGVRKSDLEIQSKATQSASRAAKPSNMATPRRCTAASGWRGASIAPSPCPSRSMQIRSRPNAEMVYWRSISRAPDGTNRN